MDYFNQHWFQYTGLSIEESAGSWLGVLHPEDAPRCRADWERARQSGEMFQSECRLRGASDGAYRWHLGRAVAERSTTGQVISWVGTFTDIEDQKRVQAIQAEFKSTLDAEPDAVMFFEPTGGHILYANQGAITLLGYSRDELLRMTPADFIIEHDGVGFGELLAALLEGPQPHVLIETTFRGRDRSAEPIDVSVQLIRIGTDRIVLIARDITERKDTQREKEILYREAVDAVRKRDEFLSVASHELKTPLSALQLQIQTLQTPRRLPRAVLSMEQIQPKLEMAQRQIARLTRLVSELMDVSRITAGRFRLEPEATDLAAIVRDVVSRLDEEATRSHSSVDVNAASPVVGMWDRSRLEQVVTNLLSNAFKFGDGKPIEVRVEERGPIGRLVVADHGIGIGLEDLERIFQRYEQAISSRSFGGLGLGLYIARQIVEAHRGTIWVESQPGNGATFTIDLPKAATATNHDAPGGRDGRHAGSDQQSAPGVMARP